MLAAQLKGNAFIVCRHDEKYKWTLWNSPFNIIVIREAYLMFVMSIVDVREYSQIEIQQPEVELVLWFRSLHR